MRQSRHILKSAETEYVVVQKSLKSWPGLYKISEMLETLVRRVVGLPDNLHDRVNQQAGQPAPTTIPLGVLRKLMAGEALILMI